nr:PREDICTED: pentatricopeptide repeat-containing protein At4g14170-like isoform X2 [Musa acuminata subsp. malaccensis]
MRFPRHGLLPVPLLTRPPPPSSSFSSYSIPWDPVASAVHDGILRARSFAHTKQAHALAAASGVLPRHLPSAAAILIAYADHGDPAASLRLFDDSPLRLRGAFLWNALVRALSSAAGLHSAALSAYNGMLRAGVRPDNRTFPFALTAAAAAVGDDARKGREIHGSVIKVFGEMLHRDVVSWNSLISMFSSNGLYSDAVSLLLELKRSDLSVNSVSLISALPACAALQDEDCGKGIHGLAIKAGLDLVVTVGNAFIDTYGKCGDSDASMRAFQSMQEKNDVSWNSVIGSLVHAGLYEDALEKFKEMLAIKVKPNSITISSLLPALVELGCFDLGKEIHGYIIRNYMYSDVFVANSLVDMYAKSGCWNKGSDIFYRMDNWNVVSWNAMIANFAQNGAELEAIGLVKEMQDCGEFPNSVTYTNVLPACARIASLVKGKEIHARSIRVCSNCDLFVSNALIDMYVKCGRFDLAQNVFNVSQRDQVSYNTLIVGYSESPLCSEALDLFLDMRSVGIEYDVVSIVGALSACGNLSALKQGKEIHCLSMRKLFDTHLFVANSLIDLYTKCGRIALGKKIFDRISNKDVASWNAMILGYGMQGELEAAINLFDLMKDEGLEYDHVSYIAVLSACSHAGLVERGKRYFNQMLAQNIRSTQMHYACMVDLLGRAGLMTEAAELVRSMPFEADSNVWGALLGACRIHGNIELAQLAAEHLFKLKPGHCGYYILLSNMYAEAGRWNEADQVRALMKSRKVKKNPGCSWVQIGNKLHAFLVGEGSQGSELDLCYNELVESERMSSAYL